MTKHIFFFSIRKEYSYFLIADSISVINTVINAITIKRVIFHSVFKNIAASQNTVVRK
jgi:hypothetical protein